MSDDEKPAKKKPGRKPQKATQNLIPNKVETWPQLRKQFGLAAMAASQTKPESKPTVTVVQAMLQPLVDGYFAVYGRSIVPTPKASTSD